MREISSGRSLARNIRYQEDLVDQLFNSSEETTLYCMTELFRIPVQPFSTIGLTVLSWRHSSTTSILQSRLEDCSILTRFREARRLVSNHCARTRIIVRKRLCLGCGGELAMAFNPSENMRVGPGIGTPGRSTAKWRCSTCGQVFTAEQLRAAAHAIASVVEQA